MTPCPGNIRHGVVCFACSPLPRGPPGAALGGGGCGGHCSWPPWGQDGRCRPTGCPLLADLGTADLGAARREESQARDEERSVERVGWSRYLTTCLALDSFPDPGLAVVVLEHLLMATWPSVIFETLSK